MPSPSGEMAFTASRGPMIQPTARQAKRAQTGIRMVLVIISSTSSRFRPKSAIRLPPFMAAPKDRPTGTDRATQMPVTRRAARVRKILNFWITNWVTTSNMEMTEVSAAMAAMAKNSRDRVLPTTDISSNTMGRVINISPMPPMPSSAVDTPETAA